jgi:hypothetical protein
MQKKRLKKMLKRVVKKRLYNSSSRINSFNNR